MYKQKTSEMSQLQKALFNAAFSIIGLWILVNSGFNALECAAFQNLNPDTQAHYSIISGVCFVETQDGVYIPLDNYTGQ